MRGPATEPDPPPPCLWLDVGAADSGLLIALWAGRDLYFVPSPDRLLAWLSRGLRDSLETGPFLCTSPPVEYLCGY